MTAGRGAGESTLSLRCSLRRVSNLWGERPCVGSGQREGGEPTSSSSSPAQGVSRLPSLGHEHSRAAQRHDLKTPQVPREGTDPPPGHGLARYRSRRKAARHDPKQVYNMKARGLGLRWVERAFLAWLRSAIAGPADARPVKPPRPGLAARAKAAAEAATAA